MKTMSVGLPREASPLTGRSSRDSNEKSTGGCSATFDAPGGASAGAAARAPPQAARRSRRNPTGDRAAGAPRGGLLVALLPDELVFTIGEEDVEGRQRAVATP